MPTMRLIIALSSLVLSTTARAELEPRGCASVHRHQPRAVAAATMNPSGAGAQPMNITTTTAADTAASAIHERDFSFTLTRY